MAVGGQPGIQKSFEAGGNAKVHVLSGNFTSLAKKSPPDKVKIARRKGHQK